MVTNNRTNNQDEASQESGEQPATSDAPQDATGTEQSQQQSDTQQAEETQQSDVQSSESPGDDTKQAATGQFDSAAQQPDEQSDKGDGGAAQDTGQQTAQGELNTKRKAMLDLIDKWMPTSLNNPHVPDGEAQDLMTKAAWTKARGQQSKKEKDDGGHPVTSCGDILAAMLRLWGSNFIGAFAIRDQDAKGHSPGAKGLGYYVEADGVQSPQPGDIIVLRNGVGQGSAGSIGHVGILVEAGQTEWRTADGGGGALPDQTASVTTRTVRFENNIPILKSPTDLKEKQLDGWVDLDKLEQTG
jgi:hypothetical protein